MSFYKMHRGWMENPALVGAREQYCRRAAWAWMIEQAVWKPRALNISGKTIHLERGQFSFSLRYLAAAWGWSVASVRRFIERLETDTMIGTSTGTGQLVITICNYDKYQSDADASGTDGGTPSGTEPAQERHKEEEGKNINIDIGQNRFDEWWSFVPKKVSKGQAEKAFKAALKKTNFQTLLDGIQAYAQSVEGKDQ